MEQAEEMAKQFTRENITLQENLKEMQVLWFQAESAESYYRQGKFYDEPTFFNFRSNNPN